MEGISNTKRFGDSMNDEAKTSEENNKEDVGAKRDSGRERREWTLNQTKEKCVIWCGRMPFWHLVAGAIGLRIT